MQPAPAFLLLLLHLPGSSASRDPPGPGYLASVLAAPCPDVMMPAHAPPTVAGGWQAQLILSNLTRPRGLLFDAAGALLVAETGRGISRHLFADMGGTCLCSSAHAPVVVVDDPRLDRGLAFSRDGRTLYASSGADVFAWPYDCKTGTVAADAREVVVVEVEDDANNATRSSLLVSSTDSLLFLRGDVQTGQVREFDLSTSSSSPSPPYNFSNGTLFGSNINDPVDLVENPSTGGIFAIEHGPGKLDFLGFVNGSCLSAQALPDNSNDTCAHDHVPPRLVFPAHGAPTDAKFSSDGAVVFMAFHGTRGHQSAGFRVSSVALDGPAALKDIMTNADEAACPDACFQPAALAWDQVGRLWMASDATGDVYVLARTLGESVGTFVTDAMEAKSGACQGKSRVGWDVVAAVVGIVCVVVFL